MKIKNITVNISRDLFALLMLLHPLIAGAVGVADGKEPVAAKAQWHVVKEWGQKSFHASVPAGNYSGITHLKDNVYAVVSDKSDSALFFRFRIDVDSLTGELHQVEMIDGVGKVDAAGLDHEAIALTPDSTLVLSSEGKLRLKEYTLAGEPTGWTKMWNAADFWPNYGFESLCYDDARQCLWTISEAPLRKDGEPSTPQNQKKGLLRLMALQGDSVVAQFTYATDAPSTRKAAQTYTMGVSELCALPDGQLLVLEREAFVPKRKLGAFCKCSLYAVNPADANGIQRDSSTAAPPLSKQLLCQWQTSLTLFGRSWANYEGMCLGPTLKDGSLVLLLLSDSQDQYAGVLRDWWKTIILKRQ